MKYKALIFDIDGTAMQTARDALPSAEVIQAVKQAQKIISVSAATGRSIGPARRLLKIFDLKDPCILCGGTQIVNPVSEKILWEVKMSKEQIKKIIKVCLPYPYELWMGNDLTGVPAKNTFVRGPEQIIYVMACRKEDAKTIQKKLSQIKDVAAHFAGSWTKDRVDIHVTNTTATKKQAVNKLTNLLKVRKEEVLAVGDTSNDIPLLESAGFKVAMGNATEDLKKIADYIAPPVEENGLAYVIRKFILD